MDEIRAAYNDGKTAVTVHVTLHVDANMLKVVGTTGDTITAWPLNEVHYVATGGDGQAKRLRRGFKQPERVTLEQKDDYKILARHCANINHTTPRSYQYWKPAITWSAIAAVSVFVLIKVIIPAMAKQFVSVIPPSLEDKLGQTSEQQFIHYFALDAKMEPEKIVCKGKAGVAALDELAQRLVRQLELPVNTHITVINHSMVNAFALPGGRILVFNGLIKEATNGNDLAGVLAHEIGHQAERHPLILAFEVAGTSAFATLFFGDISGGALMGGVSQFLLDSGYQLKMERQADNTAITLLNRTGIDGEDYADFFLRLEKKSKRKGSLLSFLSTHPSSKDRSRLIRTTTTGHNLALTPQQWASVRKICD